MCKNSFEEVKKDDFNLLKNLQKNICDGGYDGKNWTEIMKNEFKIEIEITKKTDINKWNRTPKFGGLQSEVFPGLIKIGDFPKTMKDCLYQLKRWLW